MHKKKEIYFKKTFFFIKKIKLYRKIKRKQRKAAKIKI